ncbi:ABC transporter permease [Albidovulum sp.]|uniref:ABC transporter permease n=1 Tax=Albidovulum sp. TaxID=1872424 RepID=UPI003534C5E8
MNTLRYIAMRLVQALPVLLGVSIITFTLMAATPGDPVRLLVGDRASAETIAAVRDRYGLDEPVLVQYFTYLKNLLQGDLGASLRYRVPVSQLIAQHYPVTLFLVVYTVVLTLPLVIALAVWSARRPNSIADQVIRVLGVLGLAVPVFWLALLFARFFGVTLGWFPVSGYGKTFGEHMLHLFLPALSTMIWVVPILVRTLRSALLDEMNRDYVLTGISKGLGSGRSFAPRLSQLGPAHAEPLRRDRRVSAGRLGHRGNGLCGAGHGQADGRLDPGARLLRRAGRDAHLCADHDSVMLAVDLLSAVIDPRVAP